MRVDVSELLAPLGREDFRNVLIRLAARLGFERVSTFVAVQGIDGSSRFDGIDNTPSGYRSAFNNHELGRFDPVMQHCKHESIPIVWDQSTYVAHGAASKFETQAPFGYRVGIAIGMHMPGGRHFFLGVDRDQPLPEDASERSRIVEAFALLTLYAQAAAARALSVPDDPCTELPSVTPRELEVLRWTLAGKTAWEVGMLLGISERTAAIHANHATHKLRCSGKHQAALKAFRLGML